jgi:catechol 2,3-dioxygenase-like lactoylglutathione lyase family enzyme
VYRRCLKPARPTPRDVFGRPVRRSARRRADVRIEDDTRARCQQNDLHPMIDHTGIGVADVARSAVFYDAVLGALGLKRVVELPPHDASDGVGYGVEYPVFWIDRFHPHGVKQHTAFAAKSRAAVDAFHAAALKTGGTDNGHPGLRDTATGYPPGYYAAFVLDLDGNNIEAVFRGG